MQLLYYFSNPLGFSLIAITLFFVTGLVIYVLKILWQKNKCQLLWTPIDSVEYRSNLSYDEFILEYASVGKPVIIADAMKDLKISTKWNFDFFRSECGSIEAIVKENSSEIHSFMTVADYLDYITTRESNQYLYIADWNICNYPQLFNDYKAPVYFPDWSKGLPNKFIEKYQFPNANIFIGHKDTSIGFHKDQYNASAWIGVICGCKQIVLFTPDQEELFYKGKVDVFNPDLEKFPLYAKANPVEAILRPGEAMYIPSGWWHQVKNLEDTIAIGSLLINRCNSELVFQTLRELSPIKGRLFPLIFKFPWLGKLFFSIGLI
ncbi:MAG: cupin-like domain-containing protein [Nostoc sp.]|uniref:cupin-like domain-containing protein n=1 Tax=Nostoc sp. TaxID=1180 RepID=UPI002FFA1E29